MSEPSVWNHPRLPLIVTLAVSGWVVVLGVLVYLYLDTPMGPVVVAAAVICGVADLLLVAFLVLRRRSQSSSESFESSDSDWR